MKFLSAVLFLGCCYSNSGFSSVYNPVEEIKWTHIKDYGGVEENGSSHYLDVIGHTNPTDPYCPRSAGMAFSQPSIRIHETQHMMHFQIRQIGNPFDSSIEGVYYRNGQGIVFKKPNSKVSSFSYMIPDELKEGKSPYQLYIQEQTSNYPSLDNIGYLFNEWAAYCSNIILNLQLEKAGVPESDNDGHASNYSPHFFGFLATGMHYLRINEPKILEDKQFKAAFALYAEYTWKLMREALSSPVFGTDDTAYGSSINKMMNFYRNSPNFSAIKSSLVTIYGADWVTELMKN